jgi:hypothetical protein
MNVACTNKRALCYIEDMHKFSLLLILTSYGRSG